MLPNTHLIFYLHVSPTMLRLPQILSLAHPRLITITYCPRLAPVLTSRLVVKLKGRRRKSKHTHHAQEHTSTHHIQPMYHSFMPYLYAQIVNALQIMTPNFGIFGITLFVPASPPCVYFLPDFLMPWEPVLSGPLPLPTLPASSSRAFLSGGELAIVCVCVCACRCAHVRLKSVRAFGWEPGA